MLNTFLNAIGYYDTDELKHKFTYIITTLSIGLLLMYTVFYVIYVKSIFVNTVTALCLLILLSVFYFLKRKQYLTAKILMILGFVFQETALVFLWFPREAHFNYFYFIIAPITFFILDFDNTRERRIIIFANLAAIVFLLFSELMVRTPLIDISDTLASIFSSLSIVSTMLSISVVYYFYANNLSTIHKELHILANTDSLTNVSNRRVLFQEGESLFHLCKKYNRNMTLILFDIDHFKMVNDNYGHPIGDRVLVEMTELISNNIRKNDLFSRYGGEEFALILKDIDTNDHIEIANSLKTKIGNYMFLSEDELNLHLTVSAGVVRFSPEFDNFDSMVMSADKALYIAKENGRNQVVVN